MAALLRNKRLFEMPSLDNQDVWQITSGRYERFCIKGDAIFIVCSLGPLFISTHNSLLQRHLLTASAVLMQFPLHKVNPAHF
jgi:hypothetical protein